MLRLTTIGLLIGLLASPLAAATDQPTGDQASSVDSSTAVTPAQVYSGLVADTVRGLLDELLVIGLFVVGAGHIAQGRREPNYYRGVVFRMRLMLLAVVVLFVTYNKLTFHVEWGLETDAVLAAAQREFSFWQSNLTAWMVVVLGPIDLLAPICLAGMFLAVARSEYFGGNGEDDERTLANEVRQLYFFTGATHAVYMLWWVAFRAFTGGFLAGWPDLLYHGMFVAAHAAGRRSLTKALAEAPADIPDDSPLLFRHVGWYSLITLTVYATRLWWYVALRYT